MKIQNLCLVIFFLLVLVSPSAFAQTFNLNTKRHHTPTPTPTVTPTPSPTPSPTPTVTPSPTPTPAGTYYISPSGSDSNAGTSTAPWRTIAHAAMTLTSGQTGIVEDGVYGETVSNFAHNGTSGSPIVLQSENLHGALTNNFQLSANYWIIHGFDISNQTSGDTVPAGNGIYIHGSNNIVEYNYIHELCEEGITPDYSDTTSLNNVIQYNQIWRAEMAGIVVAGKNWLVQDNEIWDSQQQPSLAGGIYAGCTTRTGNDADYLRFFGSGHDIKHNYFHDTVGGSLVNPSPHSDCFQTWNYGGNAASNDLIERNFCTFPAQWTNGGSANNHMGSIEDWTGPLTFQNNVVVNAYQGLITDYNPASSTFQPLYFFNNTEDNIYTEGIQFLCAGGGTCTQTDARVENNIFSDQGHGGDSYICLFANNLTKVTLAQNDQHMHSGSTGTYACSYTTHPQNLNNDPLFTSAGTLSGTPGSATVSGTSQCDNSSTNTCANYNLQGTSPDIANGVDLRTFNVLDDYVGTLRPSTPSLGAYQMP